MSMTRKHYVAIAQIINDQMVTAYPNKEAMRAIQGVAVGLATTFRQDNPRFDSATFYAAASVKCYRCSNYSHFADEPCGNE